MSILHESKTREPTDLWNDNLLNDNSLILNSDFVRLGENTRKNCCQPFPSKTLTIDPVNDTMRRVRQALSGDIAFEGEEAWTLSDTSMKYNNNNNNNNISLNKNINNDNENDNQNKSQLGIDLQPSPLPQLQSNNISVSAVQLMPKQSSLLNDGDQKNNLWEKVRDEEENEVSLKKIVSKFERTTQQRTTRTDQEAPLARMETRLVKINSMRQALNLVVIVASFLNSVKMFASQYKFKRLREKEFIMIADKCANYQYYFENEFFISNLPSSWRKFWTSFHKSLYELPFCGIYIRKVITGIRWRNSLILPNSMIKILWDCYIFSILSLNIFYVPIKITWEDNDQGGLILNDWVQIFLNDLPGWTFLFDIILTFNTAIYSKGHVIFNRKKIVKHYFKTKFIGDVLIVIPFIVSLRLNINLLNAVLLLRTNKMLKHAQYFEQLFNFRPQQAALYNLFKLIFMIIFVAHFCGCMFFLVANVQKSYMPEAVTWIDVAKIVDEDWFVQYITSLYWAVITMVTIGYGDIVPITAPEKAFVILVTLISCGVFAYSINQIGVLISTLTERSNEMKIKMALLTRHLRNRGVSHDLQMQVRKYFEYWHQGKQENDGELCDQMIDSLSNTLRSEVLNDIRYRLIQQMPILKTNFSTAFLKTIAMQIRTKRTKPEEILIEEQQVNDNLYLLVSGFVCSYISIKKDHIISYTSMKQFKVGSIFDQVSFMADLRCLTGYRSLGSCTLYYICKEDFLKELVNFPSDYEKYKLIKDNISIYRSQRNIGTKCHFCDKYTHSFDRCPQIKYIPYAEKQLMIYRASIEQIRGPHIRRTPRFRALEDNLQAKERAVNYLVENNPFANEEDLIERLELINIGEEEFFSELIQQPEKQQQLHQQQTHPANNIAGYPITHPQNPIQTINLDLIVGEEESVFSKKEKQDLTASISSPDDLSLSSPLLHQGTENNRQGGRTLNLFANLIPASSQATTTTQNQLHSTNAEHVTSSAVAAAAAAALSHQSTSNNVNTPTYRRKNSNHNYFFSHAVESLTAGNNQFGQVQTPRSGGQAAGIPIQQPAGSTASLVTFLNKNFNNVNSPRNFNHSNILDFQPQKPAEIAQQQPKQPPTEPTIFAPSAPQSNNQNNNNNNLMNVSGGNTKKLAMGGRSNAKRKTRTEDLAILKLRQAKLEAAAAAATAGQSSASIANLNSQAKTIYNPTLLKVEEAPLNISNEISEGSQKSNDHKRFGQTKSMNKNAQPSLALDNLVDTAQATSSAEGIIRNSHPKKNTLEHNNGRSSSYHFSAILAQQQIPPPNSLFMIESQGDLMQQHRNLNSNPTYTNANNILNNNNNMNLQSNNNAGINNPQIRRPSIQLINQGLINFNGGIQSNNTQTAASTNLQVQGSGNGSHTQIASNQQQMQMLLSLQQQYQQQIQVLQQQQQQQISNNSHNNIFGSYPALSPQLPQGQSSIPQGGIPSQVQIQQQYRIEEFLPIMEMDSMKSFNIYYPSGNFSAVLQKVSERILKLAKPMDRRREEENKFKKSVNKIIQIRKLQNTILKKNFSARVLLASSSGPPKKILSFNSTKINV